MPEFDANDEMRLPAHPPEGSEEPAQGLGAPGAHRPGKSTGRRSARPRGRTRFGGTLASRRRRRRLSCASTRLLTAGSRNRRARCQTRRALPGGSRG